MRVLVVDDEIDTAETLAEVLATLGHQARTVPDGEHAVAAAIDFAPDVVLLDLGLPGMDGYEVARRLRAEPRTQSVRIIAVTGYGQDVDRKNTERAGFDQHVVKPIKMATLEKLLASGR
jgi:CheY-like chemotaxis protein